MIRRFLPQFSSYEWTGSDNLGEYEGREYAITWGRWTAQVAFGRHNRRFG